MTEGRKKQGWRGDSAGHSRAGRLGGLASGEMKRKRKAEVKRMAAQRERGRAYGIIPEEDDR
jgi:hypothetical protein